MDLFDTIQTRRSVRRFEDREIEAEKVSAILDAVVLAPSAGDLQAYEIVVVRDASVRELLARAAYGQGSVAEAPVVLVFCADHQRAASKYGTRGSSLYAVQDATIAAAYAQLAGVALGLSSVWIGAFDPDAAAAVANVPDWATPVAMIPLGYALAPPNPRPRPTRSDIVRADKF